jgi:small subunit ribosomal protein S21
VEGEGFTALWALDFSPVPSQKTIERKVKGLSFYRGLEVQVVDNDVEKALRQLKKKLNDEGLFKTLRLKRSYEKPSEYRRRKERESRRRRNRMLARRRQRERR